MEAKSRKPRRRKLSEKAVRDALIKAGGNAAEAARALGTARSSVWHYIETRPEIRQVVNEQREELADYAEAGLLEAVQRGDAWAIKFALTQTAEGRRRGYGDTQPVDVAANVTVKHESAEPISGLKSRVAEYLESIGAGRPGDADECQAQSCLALPTRENQKAASN